MILKIPMKQSRVALQKYYWLVITMKWTTISRPEWLYLLVMPTNRKSKLWNTSNCKAVDFINEHRYLSSSQWQSDIEVSPHVLMRNNLTYLNPRWATLEISKGYSIAKWSLQYIMPGWPHLLSQELDGTFAICNAVQYQEGFWQHNQFCRWK